MKKATSLGKLKRVVDAIERGNFELVEFEAIVDRSQPRLCTVTVILDRLVVPGNSNKKPPRQSKVRELIFDEED